MKEITTLFETIGKRRKLIGFEAKYNGEIIGTFDTRDEAQAELDRIAYELAAVLAHRELPRQRCLLCGGDHSAEDCPRIHPIDATALLEEADVLLSQTASHPGPDCSCPDCTRAAERLIIDAFMTRLRFDAGVLCSFCGDEHADSACPQKRPLLAPRVCGNCGGQHSIQQCSDIRRLLFAA